jgi:hypothetical protein
VVWSTWNAGGSTCWTPSNWLGAIGIVPLATALIGWCPAYLPFGINTCDAGTSKR